MAYVKKADRLNILVLEDSIERIKYFKEKFKHHNSYFFDNVDDAIEALELLHDKKWDAVFLDHDLEGKVFVSSNHHNTGYTVAKFISERKDIEIGKIIIHSLNPSGASNMKYLLPDAIVMPFTRLKSSLSI